MRRYLIGRAESARIALETGSIAAKAVTLGVLAFVVVSVVLRQLPLIW